MITLKVCNSLFYDTLIRKNCRKTYFTCRSGFSKWGMEKIFYIWVCRMSYYCLKRNYEYELWGLTRKNVMIMSYEYEDPHNNFFPKKNRIMSYEYEQPWKISNTSTGSPYKEIYSPYIVIILTWSPYIVLRSPYKEN